LDKRGILKADIHRDMGNNRFLREITNILPK
jgi:hypothetical protein